MFDHCICSLAFFVVALQLRYCYELIFCCKHTLAFFQKREASLRKLQVSFLSLTSFLSTCSCSCAISRQRHLVDSEAGDNHVRAALAPRVPRAATESRSKGHHCRGTVDMVFSLYCFGNGLSRCIFDFGVLPYLRSTCF